jgi:ectoine hydroxylase-related dioxygenase (phytanoyl-CoA dioxygenase family)
MFANEGFGVVRSVVPVGTGHAAWLALANLAQVGAGTRNLLSAPWCAALANELSTHPDIAAHVPSGHAAVQCTYFEKTRDKNWLVTLHQDLSIPVAERVAHPALTGWSEKEGALYVQPTLEVLQDLVAVRLHIDACGAEDGPLRVVPGTHGMGLIPAQAGPALRDARGEITCLAAPGDVVLMRPLALHASSKATGHSRRKVLHFLFGPPKLPHGLRWQPTREMNHV